MTTAATIESLTDRQAVRVLALVVDHQGPLPDHTRLREIAQATADPELDEYRQPSPTPPTPGELARATLGYLATADPNLSPTIDRAEQMTDDTRFEPATIAIGGLVLLALQMNSNSNAIPPANGRSSYTRSPCATGPSASSWPSPNDPDRLVRCDAGDRADNHRSQERSAARLSRSGWSGR